MSLNHGARIVTDGLLFCIDAANPKSNKTGSTINDLSGNGYDAATDNSSTLSYNSSTKAYEFSDDSYVTGTTVGYVQNFSAEMVLRVDSATDTYNGFIGSREYGYPDYDTGFNLDTSDTTQSGSLTRINVELSRSYSGYYERDIFTGSIPFGDFFHMLLTVSADNNTVRLYINGEQDYEKTDYAGTQTSLDSIWLGSRHTSNSALSRGLEGQIALARIYTKELTAEEVTQNYNAIRGRFGL